MRLKIIHHCSICGDLIATSDQVRHWTKQHDWCQWSSADTSPGSAHAVGSPNVFAVQLRISYSLPKLAHESLRLASFGYTDSCAGLDYLTLNLDGMLYLHIANDCHCRHKWNAVNDDWRSIEHWRSEGRSAYLHSRCMVGEPARELFQGSNSRQHYFHRVLETWLADNMVRVQPIMYCSKHAVDKGLEL